MRTVKTELKKCAAELVRVYPALADEITYMAHDNDFIITCILWIKSLKKTKLREYGIDYTELLKNAIMEHAELLHEASEKMQEELKMMKGALKNDA